MIYFKLIGLFFFNYVYLYLISLIVIFLIFWTWMIYVDRLHLREICRNIGKNLRTYVKLHFSSKYKEMIEKCLFYQLNTLSECSAGFTNGLIFDEPTVNVRLMVNAETETLIETCDISVQTDPIEPEIKEVFVDIIKEVEKEVIREILVVKEVQVPMPMNIHQSSTISSDVNYDIFGTKSKNYLKPSLDDDNKADYDTMILNKQKRVRIKQKNINTIK